MKILGKSNLKRAVLLVVGFIIGLLLVALPAGGYLLHAVWQQLPAVDHLAHYRPAQPLRIFSSDGELLAEYGEERREVVPIEHIPILMRQALLAIEDARYYQHGAVDYYGLLRATFVNLVAGQHAQGGSTITMQVARDFFLTRNKTFGRKLMEILMAYKLEATYSKDRLLELYMNQIYLGQRAYGFAAAANIYFGKSLNQLDAAEAAMLAGLPKAPSANNPITNPKRAQERQQYILKRMLELGYLNADEYRHALAQKLTFNTERNPAIRSAAYAVEAARQYVIARYGDDAYTRGLDVVTTIRMPQQRAADAILRSGLIDVQARRGYRGPEGHVSVPAESAINPKEAGRLLATYPDSDDIQAAIVLTVKPDQSVDVLLRNGQTVHLGASDLRIGTTTSPKRSSNTKNITPGAVIRVTQDKDENHWRLTQLPEMQGALVSMDNTTGDILAWVGGFDFRQNKFDHANQALRQPGSSFKPFVYSAALEKGYFPGTLVDDTQRLLLPNETGARAWQPRNYGNNYEGFITVRRGLARSKNLVTVNLMQAAGATYVQQFATQFGFQSANNPASLPLALGAGAVTPLQLAQAYSVFADGGIRLEPTLVALIRDRAGHVLYRHMPQTGVRVISTRNAYVMDSMLRDVIRSGTGHAAKILGRNDVAGKTGTSNNALDVWFAGYSSGVASVVWLGYDQPKSLGNATGATLALPIWVRYMQTAVANRAEINQAEPVDLAVANGDYVYPEYLNGQCLDDHNTFIRSGLKCQPAQPDQTDDETLKLTEPDADKEEVLRLFPPLISTEDD